MNQRTFDRIMHHSPESQNGGEKPNEHIEYDQISSKIQWNNRSSCRSHQQRQHFLFDTHYGANDKEQWHHWRNDKWTLELRTILTFSEGIGRGRVHSQLNHRWRASQARGSGHIGFRCTMRAQLRPMKKWHLKWDLIAETQWNRWVSLRTRIRSMKSNILLFNEVGLPTPSWNFDFHSA